MYYDYLIVGAGFCGMTLAERLATQKGKRCLVVDKRSHIGGNAYDEYDKHGVLIHKYGPHYFRTDSPEVVDYLSKFTEWQQAKYEILSWSNGEFWQFPINLNTFEQLIGRKSSEDEFKKYLETKKVPIKEAKNSEEVIIQQIGWELYEKFFKNYTIKQWKREPKSLDASVCGRIPIRTNRDNSYLKEKFQALPAGGYTKMFKAMLAASDNIELLLNTNYRHLSPQIKYGHMVFTGPIDEFYSYKYGALPYRSLRFEEEHFTQNQLIQGNANFGKKGFWQPALQINYPNDFDFTRIVELKHVTGQNCAGTTIVKEYPEDYTAGKEAYYPIPAADAKELYQKYLALAKMDKSVTFMGRLANYKYYNMDQVVKLALDSYKNI